LLHLCLRKKNWIPAAFSGMPGLDIGAETPEKAGVNILVKRFLYKHCWKGA